MMVPFNETDNRSLFGTGYDIIKQEERLQAALSFMKFRKEHAQYRLKLSTLGKKDRSIGTFKAAVRRLVDDDQYGDFAAAFVQRNPTEHHRKLFVLFCFITPTSLSSFQQKGLTSIFIDLFFEITETVDIRSETFEFLVSVIKEVCNTESTSRASSVLEFFSKDASLASESRTAKHKRPRFEQQDSRPEVYSSDTGGLVLKKNPDAEVVHPGDALSGKPDSDLVIQFSQANAERLEGALSGRAFLDGILEARQWRVEEHAQRSSYPRRTSAIMALIPEDQQGDFSFVFRIGNSAGWQIVHYLQFSDSSRLKTSEPTKRPEQADETL